MSEVSQLLVGANDLQTVTRKDKGFAGRDVDALLTTLYARHLNAIAFSKSQFGKRFPTPLYTYGHVEGREMYVALHQAVHELRLASLLGIMALTLRKVLGKGLFQNVALFLQPP